MVPSWQLMLGIYVISAHSIPDWNVDTQNTDMVSSEWVPGNGITNSARPALANSDGRNEFIQPPGGSNVVSSEIPIAQGRSRCAFDTKGLPRRMRARGGESCAADLLQLNNGEEKGRQLLPVEPNAQQGGGGQNNDGSGYPDRRVILPSTDDIVQDLFIPKENRPKPNSELCPDPLHPVPVCGKPSNAYLSIYPVPGRLTVNPCYLCTFFSSVSIFFHDDNSHEKLFFLFFFVCAVRKVEIDAEDSYIVRRRARCRLFNSGRRKNWLLLSDGTRCVWICKCFRVPKCHLRKNIIISKCDLIIQLILFSKI